MIHDVTRGRSTRFLWSVAARLEDLPAAEQAPPNCGARAGGRRLSAALKAVTAILSRRQQNGNSCASGFGLRVRTAREGAMKTVTGGSCGVLLALMLMMDGHTLNARASCESLSSLALPNTSITLAQMVPAGGFTLPGTGPAVPQFSQLPAFCRVAATLTPSSASDIKIEVWLPAQAWNGKFQAAGNGGWAGTITYGALASALQEGYATASTDTGHTGGNASFA